MFQITRRRLWICGATVSAWTLPIGYLAWRAVSFRTSPPTNLFELFVNPMPNFEYELFIGLVLPAALILLIGVLLVEGLLFRLLDTRRA